ncbi:DNA fragmentation factor subunit beta isoform X2 [Tyto alba]|uniref:DNA fragmentation factor subunit beta isoform X2 n=1 Tax=Tyto alba TaxID=56313 RepID=UPI001C6652E4|nr:DNA fragmentation factor subunit beta isoform X2 [Tyto alba]
MALISVPSRLPTGPGRFSTGDGSRPRRSRRWLRGTAGPRTKPPYAAGEARPAGGERKGGEVEKEGVGKAAGPEQAPLASPRPHRWVSWQRRAHRRSCAPAPAAPRGACAPLQRREDNGRRHVGAAAGVPPARVRKPAEVRRGGRELARVAAEGLPAAAGVSDLERFLAALSAQRDAVVAAARKLLSDERAPRRQKLLADLLHNLSENILAEHREEDEKWFEGLESRFKNKSSYMRYSCESRIRSYMKEVSSSISNVHPTAKDAYKRIIDLMSDKLKSVKYNGCYFDRREEEAVRLCTTEGWFSCQGPFDRDDCPCKHSINPYSNRESRILFSTWNLDHVIEKKRAVVPELAEAVKTRGGREVNWEYFYQLLFTVDNLKLVHIACHKKTNHNLSCDKTKIYRKKKQNHKIS